ncbi:MAG: S41 family peptidase [Candidatus Acidiferrales bacterium]
MHKRIRWVVLAGLAVAGASIAWVGISPADDTKYATITNSQAREMLDKVEADIKANYFDPKMHGMDLDKRFGEARQKISAAKSQDEALLSIAAAVAALDDSHTRFTPPVRPYGVEYGWDTLTIGDSACYVTAVRADSDAAAKGLKPGDQIVSINGIRVQRDDLRNIEYSYFVFPQSGFHLDVRSPDGVDRTFVAMAKVIPGQVMITHADVMTWARTHRYTGDDDRSRYHEANKQVLFWKLPDFLVDPANVDGLLSTTRNYGTVVFDLRGNPGGLIGAEEKFLGGVFDHDVKIGDRKSREGLKPVIAKTRGKKAFDGKLIVLIDSKSASASELFARVVQLEKRGTVLGDRSAGAVREGKMFVHAVALDRINVTQYSAMISVADLIMTDGKTLEHVGVMPDERVLPTSADIAAGRDPVLARAAELAGVKLTPEEAGKIFPFQWPKEEIPRMD